MGFVKLIRYICFMYPSIWNEIIRALLQPGWPQTICGILVGMAIILFKKYPLQILDFIKYFLIKATNKASPPNTISLKTFLSHPLFNGIKVHITYTIPNTTFSYKNKTLIFHDVLQIRLRMAYSIFSDKISTDFEQINTYSPSELSDWMHNLINEFLIETDKMNKMAEIPKDVLAILYVLNERRKYTLYESAKDVILDEKNTYNLERLHTFMYMVKASMGDSLLFLKEEFTYLNGRLDNVVYESHTAVLFEQQFEKTRHFIWKL